VQHRSAYHAPVLIHYAVGVTDLYLWSHVYQHTAWETEALIRQTESRTERCAERIDAWKPMPVRTVEEEARKADADKAARKAMREAASAAKKEKEAATKAKKAALEAKRTAIRQDFENAFRALAADSLMALPPRQECFFVNSTRRSTTGSPGTSCSVRMRSSRSASRRRTAA
jgi:hypothetical protein